VAVQEFQGGVKNSAAPRGGVPVFDHKGKGKREKGKGKREKGKGKREKGKEKRALPIILIS
jgi:hypothetical protein